jgi:sulfur-carrier protein adenylyltransferase/sulfurtransferase
VLEGAGFREVYSMEGGIRAWKGLVAEGAPESGMAWFPPSAGPRELIALAWALEDGSRRFYAAQGARFGESREGTLFGELAAAEERHEAALLDLAGGKAATVSASEEAPVMEGGVPLDEALKWAQGKEAAGVLEFALSAEVNSYDLYLKMRRRVAGKDPGKLFDLLSREEKGHIERLASVLQERIR